MSAPIWAVAVGWVVAPLFFAHGYYRWIEIPFIVRARRLAATTQVATPLACRDDGAETPGPCRR